MVNADREIVRKIMTEPGPRWEPQSPPRAENAANFFRWAANATFRARRGRRRIGAPRNTPAEIIDKLNKAINAGFADPKLKARLADLGSTALAGSPADFGQLIAEETEKWSKVIRAASIKAE